MGDVRKVGPDRCFCARIIKDKQHANITTTGLQCLNQIRRAGKKIKPEHLLFNGFTAGDFALMFILGDPACCL